MNKQQLIQTQKDMVASKVFIRCELSQSLKADEEGTSGCYLLGRYGCLVLPETAPADIWSELEGRYIEECQDAALVPREYTLEGSEVVDEVLILKILEVK